MTHLGPIAPGIPMDKIQKLLLNSLTCCVWSYTQGGSR